MLENIFNPSHSTFQTFLHFKVKRNVDSRGTRLDREKNENRSYPVLGVCRKEYCLLTPTNESYVEACGWR